MQNLRVADTFCKKKILKKPKHSNKCSFLLFFVKKAKIVYLIKHNPKVKNNSVTNIPHRKSLLSKLHHAP